MMIRIGCCVVAVLALAACEPTVTNCGSFATQSTTTSPLPLGPTSVYCGPVTTLDNHPGSVTADGGDGTGTGGDGGSGGEGGSWWRGQRRSGRYTVRRPVRDAVHRRVRHE